MAPPTGLGGRKVNDAMHNECGSSAGLNTGWERVAAIMSWPEAEGYVRCPLCRPLPTPSSSPGTALLNCPPLVLGETGEADLRNW